MKRDTTRFVVESLETRIMLTLLGQQLFPSDNPWNQQITNAPVAPNSAAIMNAIISQYGDGNLHPDFGQDTQSDNPLYGIPYNIVHGNTQPKLHVVIDDFPDESDLQDVPIPSNAVLEGDNQNGPVAGLANRGDSHLIIWDEDNNVVYELYNASRPSENSDGNWHAGCEAVWNLNANTFRTLGYTSADAAGLPILPGLVRPDEGLPVSEGGQGIIKHAIRFTLENSVILDQFLYPASHTANPGNTDPSTEPPMGARFRLKASVDISQLDPESRIIAQAMKDYGMILADNGSNFFITGASYSVDANNNFALTWNDNDVNDTVHGLKSLPFSDFEVVDLTPAVTSLSASSGSAGTQISITGYNFSGAAGHLQVLFGSTPATNVSIIDDSHITATVPAGTGTVDVLVQSGVADPNDSSNINSPIFGYGTSATSSADKFTYSGTVNHPPNTPTNLSPINGATGTSLTPTLQASAFSDPDIGDAQAAAQWQVFQVSNNSLVWDSGSEAADLTSAIVPAAKLASSTSYHWQVRYEDNHGAWSAYSTSTSFTTMASVAPVATPMFSVASGSYVNSVTVAITDSAAGATIHYTTNGSTPTAASPTYSAPLLISSSLTLKAIAIKVGVSSSAVASAAYALAVATPTFSQKTGNYLNSVTVALLCATSGAAIHYTLNGSTPTASSPLYTGSLTIKATATIKAIAIKSGLSASAVATAAYTIVASASVTLLPSGKSISGLAGAQASQKFFEVVVPAGKTTLTISITGGSGNADLYLRRSALPSTAIYDSRSVAAGNTDKITLTKLVAGTYYILLYGASAYSGVTIKAL